MATRAISGGASAPPFPPLDVLLSAIPSLPRPVLARLTERMIDRMDEIDPDADVEANGDEEDGTFAEDDWAHRHDTGAGCPISDPGGTYRLG